MPKLLLTLPYASRIGGVESWFSELVQCLPPLGWKVEALAMAPRYKSGWTPPLYWNHVLPIGKPWWSNRDYARVARREYERLQPDVIVTYAYDSPIISGPNIPPGPRVVEGIYTGLPAEVERIRAWYPYFDAILARGPGTRAAAESALTTVPVADRPPVRALRVGLGFPENPTRPDPDGPLRLLWFGRLHRHVKRVFDLIPIAARLDKAGVRFTLTVLGEGVDKEEFKRAVASELPPGLIDIRPVVQAARVYDVLAGHHLFLSTSECEGGPRTLVEAMSCHIIPIVTNIPGYSQEIVENGVNGYQVAVGDVDAFVDRVIRLDRDRALLQRFSAACRPAVVEAFSMERMSRELDEFFRGLLAAPSQRRFDRQAEDLARCLPDRWPWMPPAIRRAARWAAWTSGNLTGITP